MLEVQVGPCSEPWDTRRVTTLLYRLFRRARRANARDARTRRRKVDRVTSSSTGSAYASDSDEFDSDLDEDDSDDDSEAEDSSADEADDSDDGRQLSTVASSDAGSLLKKTDQHKVGLTLQICPCRRREKSSRSTCCNMCTLHGAVLGASISGSVAGGRRDQSV